MAIIPQSIPVQIGSSITVEESADLTSRTYKIDFGTNTVSGYIDGVDAMRQAIYKILQTERFAYLIYSWDYGVELQGLYGKSSSVVQSELSRVIREALLTDTRITDIRDINVTRSGRNSMTVSFVADTKFGSFPIEEVNASV